MRGFLLGLFTILMVSCSAQPAYANEVIIHNCAYEGFTWSQIVKYKDSGVYPHDVSEIIAPRLSLPYGWESVIDGVVQEIYEYNLTAEQVFSKMFLQCLEARGLVYE